MFVSYQIQWSITMESAQKFLICVWLLWPRVAAAQDVIIESGSADPIDVSAVMDRVGAESAATDPPQENWWRSYATQSISDAAHPIPASVNDLLQLALMNSAKIRVAEYVPQDTRNRDYRGSSRFRLEPICR